MLSGCLRLTAGRLNGKQEDKIDESHQQDASYGELGVGCELGLEVRPPLSVKCVQSAH